MASLDLTEMATSMLEAAKNSFGNKWKGIRELGTISLYSLAQNFIDIQTLRVAGVITEEQAKLKTELQKNAFKTVLLTEEGMGLLAVEAALNAAIQSVKNTVNTALGFLLL